MAQKVKRKSPLHPRGKKPRAKKRAPARWGDPSVYSDEGRRLLKDPAIIAPCTECAWRLQPGEQRRFVKWKTAYGKTGGPNLVCRPCAFNHDDGGRIGLMPRGP